MLEVNSSQSCSYYYRDNPFVSPLLQLHGKVVTLIHTPLPQEGKFKEIAKRVMLLFLAAAAYVVLGLSALLGIAFDSKIRNRVIIELPPQKTIKQAPHPVEQNVEANQVLIQQFSMTEEMANFSQKFKQELTSALAQHNADSINAAKWVSNISFEEKNIELDCLISSINRDYLPLAISNKINESSAVWSDALTQKLHITGYLLLKCTLYKIATIHYERHIANEPVFQIQISSSWMPKGSAEGMFKHHLNKLNRSQLQIFDENGNLI